MDIRKKLERFIIAGFLLADTLLLNGFFSEKNAAEKPNTDVNIATSTQSKPTQNSKNALSIKNEQLQQKTIQSDDNAQNPAPATKLETNLVNTASVNKGMNKE